MACACHRTQNQIGRPENAANLGFEQLANFIPVGNLPIGNQGSAQQVHNCRCNEPCTITPRSGCRDFPCECIPIEQPPDPAEYQICCDQNGCCKMYSRCCRNLFWPEFSHPRWLCCDMLYCLRNN